MGADLGELPMPYFVKNQLRGYTPTCKFTPKITERLFVSAKNFHCPLLRAPLHIHSPEDATTLFHNHHHHHQVARPAVSIAVSITERHLEQSCARSHAELRPRLVGCRSDSMVRSQVRRGRPLRRRQLVGRRLMAA